MDTKTCNLTENELRQLVIWHGYNLNDEGKAAPVDGDMNDRIERINYLNRRLKTFGETEVKIPETASTGAKPVGAWPTNG